MSLFLLSCAYGFQDLASAFAAILLTFQIAPAANAAEPPLSYEPSGHSCPPRPPALEKVELPGYYENREMWRIRIKPLYSYLESLSRITDAYVRTMPPSPDTASCGLNWLYVWASEHALSGSNKRAVSW